MIDILRNLVKFKTVTPNDDGSLEYVKSLLEPLGYTCHIVEFSGRGSHPVKNMYAYNSKSPKLCFAGHLDVVPVGDLEAWYSDPFTLTMKEGVVIGRGVVDMKGAVTAFLDVMSVSDAPLALLLTMDEEGAAVNGTARMFEYIAENKLPMFTHCIVGEPTSENVVCDTLKIGRRGSLSVKLNVRGVQGHVAYPHKAMNPCSVMVKILHELKYGWVIDEGNEWFDPSNLEIVSIDVGNSVTNVIPANTTALLNIRFNDCVTADDLKAHINSVLKKFSDTAVVEYFEGAEPFISMDEMFVSLVVDCVKMKASRTPKISTTGGTSDARFISKYAKTIELGLKNESAHKVNESSEISDIKLLRDVYAEIIHKHCSINSI